jgi:hypothetical protein
MLRDHWREFPQELSSIDEIPAPLREHLSSHLAAPADPIHMYSIPQPRGFWDWFHDTAPRNTVFLLKPDAIVIARENQEGHAVVEQCAIKDVIAIEAGTVLLNSWLTVTAANSHATHAYRLDYGTIFERSFRDSILWLRALTGENAGTPPHHLWRMPGEEHIKALPIKFNNAARSYWLDGESALTTCFIAPLYAPGRFVRQLRRNYSCATAVVVSNCEVCIITEQAMTGTGRWGQSWRFCPLAKIAAIEVVDAKTFPELHLRLSVDVARPDARPQCDFNVPFDPAQQDEIDRLIKVVERCRLAGRG